MYIRVIMDGHEMYTDMQTDDKRTKTDGDLPMCSFLARLKLIADACFNLPQNASSPRAYISNFQVSINLRRHKMTSTLSAHREKERERERERERESI